MKKSPNWTPEEIKLLRSDASTEEVATSLGRTVPAVRGKRQRLKIPSPRAPLAEATTFEEDKEKRGEIFWKSEYSALQSKYEKAVRQASVSDRLVELASELAPKSYHARPAVSSGRKGKGSPQSAVLLLSDTHIGQVISPDQTLGFGGYNFPTFLARLKFLEEGVVSILSEHTTTKIDELVLCLGGDLLDGALAHGAEAKQKNTLFCQFYAGGHALAQFIRNLAPHVPKIRIKTVVGNHPRWGTQHKMPTENRFSNLDHFLSAYIEALTKDLPTVEWSIDKQPFALFNVQGFKFHLSHGDHLRGGDKALGVPNHSVGRLISSTAQLFGKHGLESPHYFLTGHLHRGIVLPHAKGSFIVNGGFPGMDCYGLISGFSPVDPSQVFFFVHPKFGKTATYDISLKFAEVTDNAPYDIPGDLELV